MGGVTKRSRVAYILLHFPFLTETFVAEEINALVAQGVDVYIVSLLAKGLGPISGTSSKLLERTWYAPSVISARTWMAQIRYLWRNPLLYFAIFRQFHACPYPKRFVPSFCRRLAIFLKAVTAAEHLDSLRIDLFHAHFAWLSAAGAWICARLLKRPFSVTVHAFDVFCSTDILPLIFGEAEHIICISEYNRQYVRKLGYASDEKISVVHCGIDTTSFLLRERGDRRRKAPLKIVSVGTLRYKKGHQVLIEACNILREQGVSFECSIVGGGDQRGYQDQIRRLNLTGTVRLLGARVHEEIGRLCNDGDIFVLACTIDKSGDRDGIPVALMEAGALGMAIVSTDVSGIPELIVPEKTGLIVPAENPERLAAAIVRLANDEELCERLGKNAAAYVREHFDVWRNSQLLLEIFIRTVEKNNGEQD